MMKINPYQSPNTSPRDNKPVDLTLDPMSNQSEYQIASSLLLGMGLAALVHVAHAIYFTDNTLVDVNTPKSTDNLKQTIAFGVVGGIALISGVLGFKRTLLDKKESK